MPGGVAQLAASPSAKHQQQLAPSQVFGVTLDPFIVYTSNLFAILSLRGLYSFVSTFMKELRYLDKAGAPCVACPAWAAACSLALLGVPSPAGCLAPTLVRCSRHRPWVCRCQDHCRLYGLPRPHRRFARCRCQHPGPWRRCELAPGRRQPGELTAFPLQFFTHLCAPLPHISLLPTQSATFWLSSWSYGWPSQVATHEQTHGQTQAAHIYFLVVPNPPKPIAAIISGSISSSSSDSDSAPAFCRLPDRFSSSFCRCAAANCSKPAWQGRHTRVRAAQAQLRAALTAAPPPSQRWAPQRALPAARTVRCKICCTAAACLLALLGLLQPLPHLLCR